jgi:hypothetical protein
MPKAATQRLVSADPIEIAIARLRVSAEMSDPVKWTKDKLGVDLYSQQREIAELVRDNRRTAVRSSHEIGKSFVAAVLAAWWIDTHPIGSAYVITTAPSGDQLKGVLWREINKIFDLAKRRYEQGLIDAPLPGRMLQTEWWVGNQRVGQGRKPADWDTDAFQGIHAEFVLAIIDEANGVPKAMWTGVEGVTSNDTSKVLAIGNPDDPDSEFARVSDELNLIWVKKKVSAFDTPVFTGEKVAPRLLRMLVGKQWVNDRKDDWGEDSPLYISRVLGEFPDLGQAKQKVVPAGAALACMDLDEDDRKRLPKTPIELGMDVAASDDGDETVIRERRGMFAGRRWTIRTSDPEKAVDLVVEAIVESGASLVKVDEIGWGWGIVAAINSELRHKRIKCRAVGVNVAKKAWQPEKFKNQRSELWWMIRDLIKDQAIDLSEMDDAQATIGQLCDPSWKAITGGKIQVEEKDETRKRIGRSPDDADALILAFARPTKSGGKATVKRAGADQPRTVQSRSARNPTRTRSRRGSSLVARRH